MSPPFPASSAPRITLLSGGIGGAKLALGVYQYLKQTYATASMLTIVANSGDDWDWLGLRVCPDADILLYTLAQLACKQQGWGIENDSFASMKQAAKLGGDSWFQLGDQDLALCVLRTHWLKQGRSLTDIFAHFAKVLQLDCTLLPACETYAPTHLRTNQGWLHLQEYLVREKAQPQVFEIAQPHLEHAKATAQVLHAIQHCDVLIFAPSNPFISIGPIVQTPGVRQALQARIEASLPRALFKHWPHSIAVSPMVGNKALKGPLAHMLKQFGRPCNALGVLMEYQRLIHPKAILHYVIDPQDKPLASQVLALGVTPHILPIVMQKEEDKINLAKRLFTLSNPIKTN